MKSGLYSELESKRYLIPHKEVSLELAVGNDAYKVIQPQVVPFISYPYEWCFSQFKDAALITLAIQKTAIEFGMSLKDCSAYNIQFMGPSPVFIDTLSFEKYTEGEPWVAYGQFCRHFLAPLALMSQKDIRLNRLLQLYIDGVPLDLASSALPFSTWFSPPLFFHIHLHAKSQKRYADKTDVKKGTGRISKRAHLGLIDSLESVVRRLRFPRGKTEWGDYYSATNYSNDADASKADIVGRFLEKTGAKTVWDLGANTGIFSRIASHREMFTVSFDIDPVAVEKNYRQAKKGKDRNLLPLLLDITNPSPGIGWNNRERDSVFDRPKAECCMALALIHHLAISNNVPLDNLAAFFREHCRYLIIEFVPKSDTQVQRLLATREDIFPDYTQKRFEDAFGMHFSIEASEPVSDSERILYFMKAR